MKFVITLFFLLVGSFVIAQSPAYNIVLQLKDTSAPYSIEMKFCEPVQRTNIKNWFVNDTSKIRWEKLETADYTCGEYFAGYDRAKKPAFKAVNQRMLWENILVFKIIPLYNKNEAMYIIVPVFIQSFVTAVRIDDVPFKPGIYELDNFKTTFKESVLLMQNNKVKAGLTIWVKENTGLNLDNRPSKNMGKSQEPGSSFLSFLSNKKVPAGINAAAKAKANHFRFLLCSFL